MYGALLCHLPGFRSARSAASLIFCFFLLLPLLFLTSGARAATNITIGETTVLSAPDNYNGDALLAQSTTLGQSGIIQSLSFYVTTASGELRLGIYDASGPNGGPGKLLAETNAFTAGTGVEYGQRRHAGYAGSVHLLAGVSTEQQSAGFRKAEQLRSLCLL